MKILPVNHNQNNRNFKSCFRMYTPKSNVDFGYYGREIIKTSTNMFREDLDWNALIKYIITHFKDKNRVNTYSLAASDGSEAISYAITLLENLPKNMLSKYFPVYASDIDKEIVNISKKGRINVFGVEFAMTERMYGIDLSKYLKDKSVSIVINGDEISESDTISSYMLIDELRDAIQYKRSDILTEIKNIKDDGNSVVMCRNVFPYLSSDYADKVIETAKQKLKSGSLFIIGDFDGKANIEQKLLANGFFQPLLNNKVINGNNIFQRI